VATYHLSVKRGTRGQAVRHSNYIARRGVNGGSGTREDLVHTDSGNLPEWAEGDPRRLWLATDKYERVNGLPFIEYELALPRELTSTQRLDLLQSFVTREANGRPYELAVHAPTASLGGVHQPHAHVMFSNRKPDGFERSPEQHFRRFNRQHPELGVCQKDGAGVHIAEMKARLHASRKLWADLQNEALVKHGHSAVVDHRSHAARGISREPERHLGAARIRKMSTEDKERVADGRKRC